MQKWGIVLGIISIFFLASCSGGADAVNTTSSAESGSPTEEAVSLLDENSAEPEENSLASENAAATDGLAKTSYKWLGLQDMPQCEFLDIYSTAHYTMTYDLYLSTNGQSVGRSVEFVESVDGIKLYQATSINRKYHIDGRIISINDAAKTYSIIELGNVMDQQEKEMKSAMESGTNLYGRVFVGKDKSEIPLYNEAGDTAQYDYYEYEYTLQESGADIIERYYMKDGDVFAINRREVMNENELEFTWVIKSISKDIPLKTFDQPNLEGYKSE